MRVETARFGFVDADEEKLIHFERGLPGFPACTRFVVVECGGATPLRWLQCVEVAEVAFLVVEPEQVLPSFELDVPDEVLASLGWKPNDDPRSLAVFLFLNVAEGMLAANLRAPVVVNRVNRRACQLILDGPTSALRHPIRPQ